MKKKKEKPQTQKKVDIFLEPLTLYRTIYYEMQIVKEGI